MKNSNGYRNYKRRRRGFGYTRRNNLLFAELIIMLVIVIIFVIVSIVKLSNIKKKDSDKTTKVAETKVAATSTQAVETSTLPEPTTQALKAFDEIPWNLVILNTKHPITEDLNIELETLKNGYRIDKRVVDELQAMFDDARKEGLSPVICSSYREMSYQQRLFDKAVNSLKAKGHNQQEAESLAATDTAIPGTSEHQLGLALDIVDINNQVLNDDQENTPVQQWLMANSYKYGFILRYPKDKVDVTGIMYEPWHYRYVGKEAAKEIYEKKITLEEYLTELGYEY
ncbi:MAG: M15 family metallopeptidase [Lachnospiraceae bacterium]|nr:M15 family metallopeptidase [Lachnospiraceae bacterium]